MPDLFDITHGVGGLWEVHTWTSPGGIVIDLNVQDVASGIFVERITGLHSLPDTTPQTSPKVGGIGERAHPDDVLGKTLVYSGEIRGATVPLLREIRTELVAAFADTRALGTMTVTPHENAGGPIATFQAKVLQLDPPEEFISRYFQRAFTLGLRLPDPRFYFPSLAVDVTHATAAVVTNPGSAPAEPVITIAGASGAVTISDGTRSLVFQDVPAGTMIVDFAAGTAKVGTAHCDLVVASSDWWDDDEWGIDPDTTVTITQTGGTSVQVEFTPSSWA